MRHVIRVHRGTSSQKEHSGRHSNWSAHVRSLPDWPAIIDWRIPNFQKRSIFETWTKKSITAVEKIKKDDKKYSLSFRSNKRWESVSHFEGRLFVA